MTEPAVTLNRTLVSKYTKQDDIKKSTENMYSAKKTEKLVGIYNAIL